MRRGRLGLTLLEVEITLFTLALALAMVAALAQQFNRITSHNSGTNQFVSLVLTLESVRAEVAQASQILSPAPNEEKQALLFERPRYLLSPTSTNPLAPDSVERVRYSLDASTGQLMRQVEYSGASLGPPVGAAGGISGFKAARDSQGNLEISFGVLEGPRYRHLSCKVARWQP